MMFIELTRQGKSRFLNTDHITDIEVGEYGWTTITLTDYKIDVDQSPDAIMAALQDDHKVRTWDKERLKYVYFTLS